MFRTAYDRLIIKANPGSAIIPVYKVRLNKDGERIVEKKGEDNLYTKIQSFADSCDINKILEKFTKTGDASLLIQDKGQFLDLTEMPKNMIEAVNMINDVKDTFNHLPESVKKKFDYDVDKFIAATGSVKWGEALGFVDTNKDGVINKDDVKKEEVKKVEEVVNE